VKRPCIDFHSWVGSVPIAQKCAGTRYVECVFMHLIGSAGHVVNSGVSGHKMSTDYFSSLGGTGTNSTKGAPGYVMPNLYFGNR
jgi:hypothetical protein